MANSAAQSIDFEETASYKLARVTTAFRSALERHLAVVGLHGGQVFVLFELWNQDGLRQVDIADRLDLSAPTINKILKGLAEINLINRVREQDDGRSTRVFLTQKGRDIRAQVAEQWLELESEYLSGLTDTERFILPDLLGKLKVAYTGRGDVGDDE
ncbi:MAG TPA: MarR family transcriptional regulator [Pyrinomonadaceae bacterium]|jgi:DNA-binding MarR family transcriptional regulator|nr:MarR family transcriptional regulator [Pyrinomonadaceae bacterium]